MYDTAALYKNEEYVQTEHSVPAVMYRTHLES